MLGIEQLECGDGVSVDDKAAFARLAKGDR